MFKKLWKRISIMDFKIFLIAVALILLILYFDFIIYFINLLPRVSLDGSALNNRILLITFIGILWYSWETRGMRFQMKRQNDLTVQENRPYLKVYIQGKKLFISNIGKSDALNIRLTLGHKTKGKHEPSPYHTLGIGKQIEIDIREHEDWDIMSVIVEYEHPVITLEKPYRSLIKLVNKGGGVFKEEPIAIPK